MRSVLEWQRGLSSKIARMPFDPMAAAVDLLDAYRAGDIEAIFAMYAENALVYCGCCDIKTITGKQALRTYWMDRLRE